MPRLIKSLMSRVAVGCETLAIFSHFEEVSFPSNPSSKRGLDDRFLALLGVEPVQKRLHLRLKPLGGRRFKVNAFAAEGPRHHLHGACLFGAPSADRDLQHAASSRREERGMPVEQPL